MPRHVARFGLLTGLFALLLSGSAGADKPTKAEIAKRGKAATAFVEVPNRGTGTAFCIHPSGLFVTNEHVVRGAENAEITLVLNPSLASQKVLKAKVVRVDKDADLALLRVDGERGLPSVQLGKVDDVSELADVVACGFPLGKALSTDRKEYPAISVNAGTVTSLRQKGGELQFIQIDVALTYGNSGGPVLDDNGKLMGVVVSGVAGGRAGINQAIPVNKVERFLKAPEVTFTPPELTPATADKPQEFKARVASFIPDSTVPRVKLVLQTGDDKPREFPMKSVNGEWVVKASPLDKAPTTKVEVSARFGTGLVTGIADDAAIKVGGKPIRFSGIRRIEFKQKPVVVLADGRTTVEGEITGLGPIEFDVGGQKVKFDLAKASQLTFQAAELGTISATVVVTVDGKDVARAEGRMAMRDPAKPIVADPSSVVITPPSLTDEKVVKKLPDVFSDVAVGGAGRYLIFHMPKLKKLAVFDVNESRVTKYIPLTEEDVCFTAGLDCVVIGLKRGGKLERWSLTTFELEKSAPPPFKDDITGVLMGHASNGPLVANGYLLDLNTFHVIPAGKDERPLGSATDRYASGDGTVFGAWNTHYSPSTSSSFVYEGGTVKRYDEGDLRHVIPGPDGKTLFTGKGIVSRNLKHSESDDASYGYCLPAVRGDYFLSLTTATAGKGGAFTVYMRGLKQPIAKLDKAEHGVSFDGWDREKFGPWKRVFLIPQANLIAVLPPSNDQVVLHKFNAEAALEKSGQNYLIVTSQPPAEVKAGQTLTYKLTVKSKSGGVKITLDSGPKEMSLAADDTLTWAVPADAAAGPHDVILSVKDSTGQEVFHTFTVKVVK